MSYKALYREWRPKTFNELVGQKHITTTIKNAVESGRIAHAYLLCGTRGTGKTSTAKILARAVNCLNPHAGEPCNECEMCINIINGVAIDVVEMDAASKNKVENIRDIIEEVQIPARDAKYKVYIIDEVHMLTIGAVNAFLKTLEEPPKNVIFILATTDPQKLPITILSRCQRYDFKRINHRDIEGRLREIVTENKIEVEDKALSFISRVCDGAMRDALSILDQCISMGSGTLTYEGVTNMIGLVTNDKLVELLENIIDKDVVSSMNIVNDIVLNGKDVSLLIKEFIEHLRNLLMIKVSNNPEDIIDMSLENIAILREQANKIRPEEIMRFINILVEAEESTKWSKQSRIYIEIAVIKMCKRQLDTSREMVLSRVNSLERAIKNGEISIKQSSGAKVNSDNENKEQLVRIKHNNNSNTIERAKNEVVVDTGNSGDEEISLAEITKGWREVLELIKSKRMMSVYAYISPSKPNSVTGNQVELLFPNEYAFAKQKVESDLELKEKLEETFKEVFSKRIRLAFSLDKNSGESIEDKIRNNYGDSIEIVEE